MVAGIIFRIYLLGARRWSRAVEAVRRIGAECVRCAVIRALSTIATLVLFAALGVLLAWRG